jgi:hypothetical protein
MPHCRSPHEIAPWIRQARHVQRLRKVVGDAVWTALRNFGMPQPLVFNGAGTEKCPVLAAAVDAAAVSP